MEYIHKAKAEKARAQIIADQADAIRNRNKAAKDRRAERAAVKAADQASVSADSKKTSKK